MGRIVTLLMLVAAALALSAEAADAAPVLTVTPSTGLVDGQLMAVSATGLASPVQHFVAECTGATISTCEALSHQAPSTAFTANIRARATVLLGTTTVDCRLTACTLAVFDLSGSSTGPVEVSTPLTFDPNGPLRPIPPLTVTPNTFVANGTVVHVTSPDYLDPGGSVLLIPCHGTATGGSTTLRCDLVSQTATATLSGAVDANFTFNPSGDETNVPRTTTGDCLDANGCRYVAAFSGSFERMLLGRVFTGADPASTTTTTTRATTPVTATPRFTG